MKICVLGHATHEYTYEFSMKIKQRSTPICNILTFTFDVMYIFRNNQRVSPSLHHFVQHLARQLLFVK